jgi:hypothetical protein
MAGCGAGAEVVGPAAREVVAGRTRGRHVTTGADTRGNPVVRHSARIPEAVVEGVAQADVLPGLVRGVGARADQGRLLCR